MMLDVDEIKSGRVVIESEDGETWWVPGHVDRDEAVEAVKVWLTEVTPETVDEWDFTQFATGHWWYVDDGSGDDESYQRCEPDTPGAEPYTQVNP
jgi:hypothetical protein